jgi:hypothetical protein
MTDGLKGRYSSLSEMLVDKAVEQTFVERANEAGINEQRLQELKATLTNVQKNIKKVPAMMEYTRVKVGTLTVPNPFLRHVELLAKFAGVTEEAVWQLLMIETCSMYADRYQDLAETINETVRNDGN